VKIVEEINKKTETRRKIPDTLQNMARFFPPDIGL
jgi:hypothetical protein